MGAPDRVRLRDVVLDDVELLETWERTPALMGEFNDFGMSRSSEDLRPALARGPLREERSGMLIIERVEDGAVLGSVGWHEVNYVPTPGVPRLEYRDRSPPRGSGHRVRWRWAAPARSGAVRHTDVNRVEASADMENLAEQRALEKAAIVAKRSSAARTSALVHTMTW